MRGPRGTVAGVEALVRWQHPSRGLLAPEHFVPLAEECGLIRAIDEWTLERALSQAGAWQRPFGARLWTSINVSAPAFPGAPPTRKSSPRCCATTRLDGRSIELEVTERVLM